MEEEQATNEPQPVRKKRGRKRLHHEFTASTGRVSRITRSQVAPEWTTKDALILVNVIAVVESDCLRLLSSQQKWKIVAENCTAQEVHRTLNQCRDKWKSLIAEYDSIRKWDSKSTVGSFWTLEVEKRRDLGLPQSFDEELFKAVDCCVKAQLDDMDTQTETGPVPEADILARIARLGYRKKKPRPILVNEEGMFYYTNERTRETPAQEDDPLDCYEIENPYLNRAEEKPQESHVEEERINAEETQGSLVEENSQSCCQKDKPQDVPAEEKPQTNNVEEKPVSSQKRKRLNKAEKMEQMMAENLHQNAEMILAIVNNSIPEMSLFVVADSKKREEMQAFVRNQADKLISCLGDIVKNLSQFPSSVQDKKVTK